MVTMVTMRAWSLNWRMMKGATGASRVMPMTSISMIAKIRASERRVDERGSPPAGDAFMGGSGIGDMSIRLAVLFRDSLNFTPRRVPLPASQVTIMRTGRFSLRKRKLIFWQGEFDQGAGIVLFGAQDLTRMQLHQSPVHISLHIQVQARRQACPRSRTGEGENELV